MSKNDNIFNENKIKNELKNFQEGSDYSVVPTADPNIKTYNFHNDKLRSMFRNDRVPVRITQEAYDGNDYTYRGHFEEGKDYRYSAQQWHYGKNYQGNHGTDIFANGAFKDFMAGIRWDEHSRVSVHSEAGKVNGDKLQKYWEARWTYQGKGNLGNHEPRKIDGHSHTPIEGQWCCGVDEVSNRRTHLEGWKKSRLEMEQQLDRAKRNNDPKDIDRVESIIATLDRKIREHEEWLAKNGNVFWTQHWETCQCGKRFDKADRYYRVPHIDGGVLEVFCSHDCAEKYKTNPHGKVEYCPNRSAKNDNSVDLVQENRELRQQLTAVQKQLVEVLAELKRLRSNSTGKDNEKLNQQIVQNERLIENGSAVSETEVRDQINKSEALMKEFNTTVEPIKNDKDNGLLPYLIGGSVILVSAGIIGCLLLKKKRRK